MGASNVSVFMFERLLAWGVRRIYGYPGDGSNGLNLAFHDVGDEMEFVQVRHEELASFAACGHAKLTGEVGVAAHRARWTRAACARPRSPQASASCADHSGARDERYLGGFTRAERGRATARAARQPLSVPRTVAAPEGFQNPDRPRGPGLRSVWKPDAMLLSFLYRAFVFVLDLLVLSRRSELVKDVELVVL